MLRLAIVKIAARNDVPYDWVPFVVSSYVFSVIKEDERYYLLEAPPGTIGGHKNSSDVSAYWVHKSNCNSGYKVGQRWKHCDFIAEMIDDTYEGIHKAIIVQSFSVEWPVGRIVAPPIERYPDVWTFMRGQEAP